MIGRNVWAVQPRGTDSVEQSRYNGLQDDLSLLQTDGQAQEDVNGVEDDGDVQGGLPAGVGRDMGVQPRSSNRQRTYNIPLPWPD